MIRREWRGRGSARTACARRRPPTPWTTKRTSPRCPGGTNLGAGQAARARRIAWTGALAGAAFAEAVGLAAALAPERWLGLFSRDAPVLAAGALYLRAVAPCYGAFGAGLMLLFAS